MSIHLHVGSRRQIQPGKNDGRPSLEIGADPDGRIQLAHRPQPSDQGTHQYVVMPPRRGFAEVGPFRVGFPEGRLTIFGDGDQPLTFEMPDLPIDDLPQEVLRTFGREAALLSRAVQPGALDVAHTSVDSLDDFAVYSRQVSGLPWGSNGTGFYRTPRYGTLAQAAVKQIGQYFGAEHRIAGTGCVIDEGQPPQPFVVLALRDLVRVLDSEGADPGRWRGAGNLRRDKDASKYGYEALSFLKALNAKLGLLPELKSASLAIDGKLVPLDDLTSSARELLGSGLAQHPEAFIAPVVLWGHEADAEMMDYVDILDAEAEVDPKFDYELRVHHQEVSRMDDVALHATKMTGLVGPRNFHDGRDGEIAERVLALLERQGLWYCSYELAGTADVRMKDSRNYWLNKRLGLSSDGDPEADTATHRRALIFRHADGREIDFNSYGSPDKYTALLGEITDAFKSLGDQFAGLDGIKTAALVLGKNMEPLDTYLSEQDVHELIMYPSNRSLFQSSEKRPPLVVFLDL